MAFAPAITDAIGGMAGKPPFQASGIGTSPDRVVWWVERPSTFSPCDFAPDCLCKEAPFPCTAEICRHYRVNLPPNIQWFGGKLAQDGGKYSAYIHEGNGLHRAQKVLTSARETAYIHGKRHQGLFPEDLACLPKRGGAVRHSRLVACPAWPVRSQTFPQTTEEPIF